MTDDRMTSDELFAVFKGLIPTPVAFYLMNGGAKLDRGALEMVQAVREQATNDRIEALSAENERLREALEDMVTYSSFNEQWQDQNPEYVDRARAALGETE